MPVLPSSVSSLHEDGPRYRGIPLHALLAGDVSFERVAALLTTGAVPDAVDELPHVATPPHAGPPLTALARLLACDLDAPDDALRQYTAHLAPDGVLGIVVPVLGSVNTRLAPRTWDQYKPPEHLWYFSPRAMRRMLQSQGFHVVHEEPAWVRRSRFVDPDARRAGLPWRVLRGVEGLAFDLAARLGGASLRIDSMAFYARREGS